MGAGLIALALCGCVYDYGEPFQPTLTEVHLVLELHEDELDVWEACAAAGVPRPCGCYLPGQRRIVALKPRGWLDFMRLRVLGHEFGHAAGASHANPQPC